ncbi:MAG TPA: DUF5666 domain-containing protein [Candidatus Saccharimonadales bacterium]|nr:DUF5666 domain-containing protein [Candidatus Saccharimonadales bacterium]
MKTRIGLTTLLLLFSLNTPVYAAVSPTPKDAPVTQTLNSQINKLKDKIASQVSQLKLVEKRGIIGTIQAVTNNQITLMDTHSQIRYVDLDEITKYTSSTGAPLTVSAMKKGSLVSVFGIYNKDSQRILARFVSTATVPVRFYGEITSIDKPNFQITVTTDDQKTNKVEIDTTSTVSSYNGGTSLSTYGFSKLAVGDRVEVIGFPDKKDQSLLIADRMLDYLSVPKDPNITGVAKPTVGVTTTPTGKGTKNISPIK